MNNQLSEEGIAAMTQDGIQELPARPRPSDGWTENAICYGEIEANAYMNALEALGAQQVCEIAKLTARVKELEEAQDGWGGIFEDQKAELARERELVQRMWVPLGEYRAAHTNKECCINHKGRPSRWRGEEDDRCPTCIKADALLETKPLAPEPVDTPKEG